MRVVEIKDGQPIKVLTDLYVVSCVHHDGFLMNSNESSNTRDIKLYLTEKQFSENVRKIAIQNQVGIFNEKESRIEFYDGFDMEYFLIANSFIKDNPGFKLDSCLFELCSKFEFEMWLEANISEENMPFDFADDFTFKKREIVKNKN